MERDRVGGGWGGSKGLLDRVYVCVGWGVRVQACVDAGEGE